METRIKISFENYGGLHLRLYPEMFSGMDKTQVAQAIKTKYPDYGVYVGGCHVSVHQREMTDKKPDMGKRYVLITGF